MRHLRTSCRPKRKLLPGSELCELVVYPLRKRFSPQQIAGKVTAIEFPNFEDSCVCRETIYNAIYALPVGELREELDIYLRQGKTTRRPPKVGDRQMPGHWGGDLIKGKANAIAVGTFVERRAGYLALVKMNDATATPAEGFSAALNRVPEAARKTLTQDTHVRPG